MNYKIKRKCKQVLALFLSVVLVFTYCDISAFALSDEELTAKHPTLDDTAEDAHPSVTGPKPLGNVLEGTESVPYFTEYDASCNFVTTAGVIIKLVAFENNIKNDTASLNALATHNASVTEGDDKSVIGEIHMQAVDSYLYDWPSEFYGNASETASCVFVRTYDIIYGLGADTGLCYYMDANGNSKEFATVPTELKYNIDLNGWGDTHVSNGYFAVSTLDQPDNIDDWFPYPIVSNAIRQTPGGWAAFTSGGTTYADCVSAFNNASARDKAIAVEEVAELFRDTSLLQRMLNGIWTEIGNGGYQDADGNRCTAHDLYKGFLLDLFMALDYMAGQGTFEEEITQYLRFLNGDGAPVFVMPVIAEVNGIRPTGEKNTMFATLPDYYGYLYSLPAEQYATHSSLVRMSALEQVATNSNNGSDNSDQAAWYNLYESVANGKAYTRSPYILYGAEDWWSAALVGNAHPSIIKRNQAFRFMPTDILGETSGEIGYTYLALGGGIAASSGGFVITADSSVSVVNPGSTVAANITVDLSSADVTSIQKAYNLNGSTAKLELKFTRESLAGVGSSSTLIDTIVSAPSGMIKSGDNLVLSSIDYNTLLPYLKGSKQIKWSDTGITVNGETTNKYKCTVTLTWSNGKALSFDAGGRKIESTYEASDTVTWTSAEPDVDAWYYSEIRDENFVEIKEGTPGNESYEAMAGVPTTEDLYVGFGATEFMVNMDVNLETSSGSRTYTYQYTAPNCYGHDDKCVYYCNGHTESSYSGGCGKVLQQAQYDAYGNKTQDEVKCDSGSSQSGSCSSGPISLTSTCSCGAKSKTTEFKPSYGSGYTECKGGDGSTDYTGKGCQATHHLNTCHPGVTFTGEITQDIKNFNYLDIAALNMWRLSEVSYEGNDELFKVASGSADPNLGYYAFYSQEGFSNDTNPMTGMPGNGRLVFFVKNNQEENNANIYGNTTTVCNSVSSDYISWEQADTLATQWMNELVSSEQVACRVVSDYLLLETSEGYQSACYDEYWSDTVSLVSSTFQSSSFSTDARNASKSLTGNPITFSEERTLEQAWTNNVDTASTWAANHITRSGYNGHYESPNSKWSNSNATSSTSYLLDWSRVASQGLHADTASVYKLAAVLNTVHPNSKNRQGDRNFVTGFNNQRLTLTGFDIIDSTDTSTKQWSESDGVEPVENGKWDTGKAYVTCTKDISYQSNCGGIDYGATGDGINYKDEVGYTWGKNEINDIVVHNPVTTQYCTVLCNDEKYDQRTAASLADGGDPPSNSSGCPADESCAYQHLICTEQPAPHEDSCYVELNTSQQCVGGFNSHTCTAECYEGCKEFTVKSATTEIVLPAGGYYIEAAGAAGKDTDGSVYQNGDVLSGYFYVSAETILSVEVGKSPTDTAWGENTYAFLDGTLLAKVYGGDGADGAEDEEDTSFTGDKISLTQTCSGDGYVKIWCCEKTAHTHSDAAGCYKRVTCGGTFYWSGWDGSIESYKVTCGSCGYWKNNDDGDIANDWVGGTCTQSVRRLNCNKPAYIYTKSPMQYLKNGVLTGGGCTGVLNTHVCTNLCVTNTEKALICENPHHYALGDPIPEVVDGQIVDEKYHYDYGDARCWEPCLDDSNHTPVQEVELGNGETVQTSDIFINLATEFWIYFPNIGDFAQQPDMLGILDTTDTLGKGYYDNMDCEKWTRNKVVTFPFAVTNPAGGWTYPANYPINLYYLPGYTVTRDDGTVDGTYYKFECLLANNEVANAEVIFTSIATNAEERFYDESVGVTNKERVDSLNKARHTAHKVQLIDVLGYIGNLTINDTGDFRFATLFKQSKNDGTWLIENLIPSVYLNLPNKIVSDPTDILMNTADASTNYHCTFGQTFSAHGGKAYDFVSLPLTPADNPIEELQNQPLRPGYQLYMDVETVGNYYGENRNDAGEPQDSNLYYKTQVTPRYWALDLDTGNYYPVDVYAGKNGEYTPVEQH